MSKGKDYSGQNLRGRSFKGQNLEGADFSYADIRGASFTNAILKGSDFRGAKAGQKGSWILFLTVFLSFIAILPAFAAGITTVFNQSLLNPNPLVHLSTVVILILPLVVTITKGFPVSLASIAFSLGVSTLLGTFLTSFSGGTALAFIFIAIGTITGSVSIAASITGVTILAGIRVAIVAGIVSVISSLAGTVVGMFFLEKLGRVSNFQLAAELAVAIMVLIGSAQGVYIGRRILVGDPKFSLIYPIAINFTSIAGTSFRNADLTKADFTGAVLKNADFTKAKLVHTRFYKAKQLDLTRTGDTILSNRRVLKLLVTGNGRNKSYAGLNLKGANLIGADLKEANLKNADITQATFQGACLEWTNLTLATAVGTDFTNSLMTGACVEAWNIESTTNLDNVDCRFIYLLENTKPGTDDKERRPSSGEFRPGEFTKLFEEVFNTVDLIFRDGIDWKAFVTAFKKVQVENENTELAIQSIENKGDGVVVVKVAVPVDTDKEKIHSGFTQNYRLALQEIEKRYKAELQAKDKEIEIHREKSSDMKEIIGLLANRPIQNIIDVKQNQGDTNMTGERNIHMGSGNYNERIEGDYVQGNYYAAGEKQTLAETAAEIQALLKQLEKSYPTDTTTGKMALATEAIAQIESNPNLKVRILSALKVGSIKAFEQCLSHPAASFVIGALEDWEKTKEN